MPPIKHATTFEATADAPALLGLPGPSVTAYLVVRRGAATARPGPQPVLLLFGAESAEPGAPVPPAGVALTPASVLEMVHNSGEHSLKVTFEPPCQAPGASGGGAPSVLTLTTDPSEDPAVECAVQAFKQYWESDPAAGGGGKRDGGTGADAADDEDGDAYGGLGGAGGDDSRASGPKGLASTIGPYVSGSGGG